MLIDPLILYFFKKTYSESKIYYLYISLILISNDIYTDTAFSFDLQVDASYWLRVNMFVKSMSMIMIVALILHFYF